jgi:hypothetical protein
MHIENDLMEFAITGEKEYEEVVESMRRRSPYRRESQI